MKTTSEITNPTAPAIIKMMPKVDSRNPCCCTTAELCAVVAQYMIAPVTADIALKTIPGKPMTSPLMWKSLLVASATARINVLAATILKGVSRFTEKTHERLREFQDCVLQ